MLWKYKKCYSEESFYPTTCQCYDLTSPPPPSDSSEPWVGFTNFSYKDCLGSPQFASASVGNVSNICALEGTVARISGDQGTATPSGVNCCA